MNRDDQPDERIRSRCRCRVETLRIVPLLLVAVSLTTTLRADDKPSPPVAHESLIQQLRQTVADLTKRIGERSENVSLYSQRGDARFFLRDYAGAVADFDRMLELDPKLAASHWRRGIALFFAKRYADAAQQFEMYHSFDDVDRENGIWRYLSQYKASGSDNARAELLKYRKDDREPFPSVYQLFAGTTTPEAILETIRQASIDETEREKRTFYAHLYIGLNDFVEGRLDSAEHQLHRAVKNTWAPTAGGGPTWMWHVARVQHGELEGRQRTGRLNTP